jgi:acyl-coenzyme A thioesterase PaaI-like protein
MKGGDRVAMTVTEKTPHGASRFDGKLDELKKVHHNKCVFKRNPPVEGLNFWFSNEGDLAGEFVFSDDHQGYDGMAHGGIVAAVIDAAMTQCLMGHGIVAYTTDLAVRYQKPVKIDTASVLEVTIKESRRGLIYALECKLKQGPEVKVCATGRFYKVR